MPELFAMFIVGVVIGGLIGVAVAYQEGWKAGCDWARKEIFGG